MKLRFIIFFLVSIIPSFSLLSQTNDFGAWAAIGINKKLKKFAFAIESEFRSKEQASQINRLSLGLNGTYKPIKYLKIGATHKFIYFNDVKYNDYQPRQRSAFALTGKLKLKDFTFFLREKVQRTLKDERDRIKPNGEFNKYKVNPEWELRSRLKVAYNIPKIPLTTSLSFEGYYELNNPDGNTFNKLRTTISFAYKLTKRHTVELYGMLNNEINISNPINTYIAGFEYTYSMKKYKGKRNKTTIKE